MYMAPETVGDIPFEQREGFSVACDVWAVGVIFYILLTGEGDKFQEP